MYNTTTTQQKKPKYETLYEKTIPNGATQLTLQVVRRTDMDTGEQSVFSNLEHFLKYSKEGPKVLWKDNLPAKKKVYEALAFALQEAAKELPDL